MVLRDGKASTSYIQRRLGVGYNRAASLIERMEKEGVVGRPTMRESAKSGADRRRQDVMRDGLSGFKRAPAASPVSPRMLPVAGAWDESNLPHQPSPLAFAQITPELHS